MTIRAVLFDVGGPLDMEFAWEIAVDSAIAAACTMERIPVDEEALSAASARAVAAFAPDAYVAMIDDLCSGDRATAARIRQRVQSTVQDLDAFQLRPGVGELLGRLTARGLRLATVANQPEAALARLERVGIAPHFGFHALSGIVGARKPDAALFLAACEGLGVQPSDCLMVGDRIDNDIAPARALGMATIRFRTGRHARQTPRTSDEAPDAEVVDVIELEASIAAICGVADR